jgi:hypothetical protein
MYGEGRITALLIMIAIVPSVIKTKRIERSKWVIDPKFYPSNYGWMPSFKYYI